MNEEDYVLHVAPLLRPGGGPAGYLYNLRAALGDQPGPVRVDALAHSENRAGVAHGAAPVRWAFLKRVLGAVAPALWARRLRRAVEGAVSIDDRTLQRWRRAPVLVVHELPLLAAYLPNRPQRQHVYYWPHCPTDWTTEFLSMPSTALTAWGPRVLHSLRQSLWRLELHLIECCDGLLASAPTALQYCFASDPARHGRVVERLLFHVLPGVPPLRYDGPDVDVRDRVGFFGRFHADKGFDLYHEAAKRLPQVQFHAWGSGPIAPRAPVIAHGFTADIAAAMSQVAVVVVPNLRTYFDLVVLEALSLAKPVVVTDTGGFRELPRTEGIFHAEPRPRDLARAIRAALRRFPRGRCEDNRALYERLFAPQPFAHRHRVLARWLLARQRWRSGQPPFE